MGLTGAWLMARRRMDLRAFEKRVDLFNDSVQPPEFQRWHADIAKRGLALHLSGLKTKPVVTTTVDGRVGASEDSVKPFGVIRYDFGATLGPAVEQVLHWLEAEALRVTSTEKLASKFFCIIIPAGRENGTKVMANEFRPTRVPDDATVLISNEASWWRMLDVQMRGKTRMKWSIAPLLLERAGVWLEARNPQLVTRRLYTATFEPQYRLETGPRAGSRVHSPALKVMRR